MRAAAEFLLWTSLIVVACATVPETPDPRPPIRETLDTSRAKAMGMPYVACYAAPEGSVVCTPVVAPPASMPECSLSNAWPCWAVVR